MILLTVGSCITVLVASMILFSRELNDAKYKKIDIAATVVQNEIEELKRKAQVAAFGMVSNPDLIEALVNNDLDAIIHNANALKVMAQIDFCNIIDNEGYVITRTHAPDIIGDNISNQPHVRRALDGYNESVVTQGAVIRLGAYAGAPIYDSDMNMIGVISLGFRLDIQEFAYRLKEITRCEITAFLHNERVSTTLFDEEGVYAIGTIAPDSISQKVLAGEPHTGIMQLFGNKMLSKYIPIYGADDEIIGMMFVGYDTTEDDNKIILFIIIGTLLTLIVLAICVIIAVFVSKVVERQLNRMQNKLAEEMEKSKILAHWYESILNTTPLPISVTDAGMNWTFVNKAAEEFLGTRWENMVGKPCNTWGTNICNTPECGIACAKRGLKQTFFTHEGKSFQVDVGTLKGLDNETIGFIEIVQDITQINEQKMELAQAHELSEIQLTKLNLVVNSAHIGLWDLEISKDDPFNLTNITVYSDSFRHMLGYSDEKDFPDILRSWADLLHPYDKERVFCSFAAHLNDTAGETPFNEEYRLLKKNNVYAYYVASCETVRDKDGSPLRACGSLMDITETKEMQRAISSTNERLMLMLDTSPLCAQIWDRNMNTIECNEAGVRLYGFKDKQEYLNRFLDVCSPEFQPDGQRSDEKAARLVNQAFEEGSCVFEWMHQMPGDGTPIPAEVTLVRAKYGDDDVVIGYTRDLRIYKKYLAEIEKTQENLRHARDTAEAANKSKSIFLANMSHEIRTPMNSIIGFSELAQDDEISTKTRQYLINISDNAKWLLNIINDILDSTKIESGKIVLEHIPFDLQDVITQCQSAILPKALEKGIVLYCYTEPLNGKKLLGDPVRMRQAFMNLLSNAVKFTNSGNVKLLTSIKNINDKCAAITFEVKDSGIGMSPEQIANIFEPFMQADDSVTRRFGGTGLGLPITKNIIELMGGTLNVESEPGIGSRFSFTLTFNLIDSSADIPSQKIMFNDIEKPNFIGEVLICEDNGLNQQVICEHLERVGLKTIVAHDGKEGVDVVTDRMRSGEKPFDLILMDIHMPVMDGLEAASKITELGVQTPVLALTANIMSNDLEIYKTSGMLDYIGKPFTSQELWKCLIKYLPVVNFSKVDRHRQSAEEEKTLRQLRVYFVKNNQATFSKIIQAVDAGDIKLAYRLVHTLKSNAGQIGEIHLQEVAAETETMISEGKNRLDEKQANILESELNSVLERLAPLLIEANVKNRPEAVDAQKAQEIIEKLEPMLIKRKPECMNLLDEIRAIPGADELVRQVEDFEFTRAIDELSKLKQSLGQN